MKILSLFKANSQHFSYRSLLKFGLFLGLITNTIYLVDGKPKARALFAKGLTPVKLAGGFQFTEGPSCDKDGNIFFTDQNSDKIFKWSTDNNLTTFGDNFGRANGTYFNKDGALITCSDEKNELWSITPNGVATVLIRDFEGKKLNGPNDLWIAPNGGMYLTDPFYKRPWWDHQKSEQQGENVYYLAPGSSKLIKIIDDLVKPNGIVGTPNGKFLYVADIRSKKTWRYQIGPEGQLSNKTLFADQGSDGMTIDNRGNIYLTGNGVTVFNSDGKEISRISIPESWTTNICFGGKDRHLLFITAVKSVYGLKMKVKGVE
jgi:gluconolactonase